MIAEDSHQLSFACPGCLLAADDRTRILANCHRLTPQEARAGEFSIYEKFTALPAGTAVPSSLSCLVQSLILCLA